MFHVGVWINRVIKAFICSFPFYWWVLKLRVIKILTFGGQKLFTGSKKTNLKAIENKIVKIELNCKLHSLNIEDRTVICKEIKKTKINTIDNIFSFKNLSTFSHAATDIKLEGNFTQYAVVCRFLRQRFCFFPHQWLHFNKGLCLLPVSYVVLSSFQCLV